MIEATQATSVSGSRPLDPLDLDGAADERALADRLEHRFNDWSLLHQALSHRSWCAERESSPSNERLEFLGDAVLGLVVAEHCYAAYPEFAEGQLAKVRSAVVNARVLAQVAEALGVGSVLLLGKGEESSGGRAKGSLLSDATEALIGAVYLDAGWVPARALVLRMLGERIARAAAEPDDFDHKSRLQEATVRSPSSSSKASTSSIRARESAFRSSANDAVSVIEAGSVSKMSASWSRMSSNTPWRSSGGRSMWVSAGTRAPARWGYGHPILPGSNASRRGVATPNCPLRP